MILVDMESLLLIERVYNDCYVWLFMEREYNPDNIISVDCGRVSKQRPTTPPDDLCIMYGPNGEIVYSCIDDEFKIERLDI